jgi:hypothetical protein
MDDSQSQDWQLILHASNQVVLYNPTSHALSIRHTTSPHLSPSPCPYCHRPLPSSFLPYDADWFDGTSRASNYFQLLAVSNERSSRPTTPPQLDDPAREDAVEEQGNGEAGIDSDEGHPRVFKPEAMAKGYFRAFFQEVCRLGMGANGSVFLCQVSVSVGSSSLIQILSFHVKHVLDGNPLGERLWKSNRFTHI